MGSFSKKLWLTVTALSSLWHTSLALPSGSPGLDYDFVVPDINNTSLSPAEAHLVSRDDDRVPLRILPFGASIMSGVGSSTKDGYAFFQIVDTQSLPHGVLYCSKL